MRITNKMMNGNALSNINNNKIMVDKLFTQMSTKQKISKPSDDPVIAIRAMRLQTNLMEIEQYVGKNIPDADAWLNVTESAITSVEELLKGMKSDFDKFANGDKTAESRKKMLENIKGFKSELYSLGNADYAGRSVFTGYRTGMDMTFMADKKVEYSINQTFNSDNIDRMTYVSGKIGVDKNNPKTEDATKIESDDVYRIRLAYDKLKELAPAVPPAVNEITIDLADGTQKTFELINKPLGNAANQADIDKIYTKVPDDAVHFIPETGELILGKDARAELQKKGSSMFLEYEKENWSKGDLQPEHFFSCKNKDENITYTMGKQQLMEYDISFNQTLRVNTLATDLFTHDTGRDVEEMGELIESVITSEEKIATIEAMMKDPQYDTKASELASMLEAAKKENKLLNAKLTEATGSMLTKMQGYQDMANVELTNCGNRGVRLDLTKERLTQQKTSFTELQSSNIGVNLPEVATQLNEASLAYDASLQAMGMISKQSLLNYL